MWVPKSGMPLAEPRQNVGHFNVCFLVRGTRPSVSRGDGESGRGTLGRPPLLGVGRDRPFPVGMASQGVGHLGVLVLFPYETLLFGSSSTAARQRGCHLRKQFFNSSLPVGLARFAQLRFARGPSLVAPRMRTSLTSFCIGVGVAPASTRGPPGGL